MAIREIRVSNVRSYELFSAHLDPGMTLILGRNGTGKTTLLESLYFLQMGTSFRGRDRDMIAHDGTRADFLALDDDGERRASLQLLPDDKVKKSFIFDGKTTARLPTKYRRPVVLFEPDELRLLSSSPDRRRKFFDGILARLYPQYATVLNRYSRILLQRNELLKRREDTHENVWNDHLFTWDIKFSEAARQIVELRRDFLVTTNARLSELYSQMAESQHAVHAAYQSNITPENYQQKLLDRLHQTRLADSYRGYTTHGPHRDDFLLLLDGHAASETASRGEMRTIMLAYKLLEVELQNELSGHLPLVLLDDVFSELDTHREQHLMHALSEYQTVITATDLRDELKINASILTLSQ